MIYNCKYFPGNICFLHLKQGRKEQWNYCSFLSFSTNGLPFTVIPHCLKKKVHKRSEEHTSELQSRFDIVCRLLLEKKKKQRLHLMRQGKKRKNMRK